MAGSRDPARSGQRSGRRRLAIGAALAAVAAVAIVVAVDRNGRAGGPAPHAPRHAARVDGPPTGQHASPTATGRATARVATPNAPALAARGWADSLASDWPFCVPGTVLGYRTGQYVLYPQYLYSGIRPDTRWTLQFFREEAGSWKLTSTTPSFTLGTDAPAEGCTVVHVPFDESDPLEDGTYLVQPTLDGVAMTSARQKVEIGGSDTVAAARRRQRETCVDLPAAYWPGATETNDVAFGRASVGLGSAELNGQVVFFPGRAALKRTVGVGYTDFAAADLAARQQMNPNAWGAKKLRYVVVRTAGTYAVFVADVYSAFVSTGDNQGIPTGSDTNPAPPPCLLSGSQATVVSWHATTAAYGTVGSDLRTVAYDWYANQGGNFTFPGG